MTKAEEMRTVTNKVNEQKRTIRFKIHESYVNKLIDKKISKLANKGRTTYTFKLPKRFSPSTIITLFAQHKFDATESRQKGHRYIIKVKW